MIFLIPFSRLGLILHESIMRFDFFPEMPLLFVFFPLHHASIPFSKCNNQQEEKVDDEATNGNMIAESVLALLTRWVNKVSLINGRLNYIWHHNEDWTRHIWVEQVRDQRLKMKRNVVKSFFTVCSSVNFDRNFAQWFWHCVLSSPDLKETLFLDAVFFFFK